MGEYKNSYSLPTPISGFPELYTILILLRSALTLTTAFLQHQFTLVSGNHWIDIAFWSYS